MIEYPPKGEDMAVLEAPPQASGSPEPGGEGVGKVVGRRCIALLAAGTLLTFLAMGSLWGWRTFASSQGFADVATDMLEDAAVREVVADKIVTVMERAGPHGRVGRVVSAGHEAGGGLGGRHRMPSGACSTPGCGSSTPRSPGACSRP